MTERPWRLLPLAPLPPALMTLFVNGAPIELLPLTDRTQDAVIAGAADADLILGDWTHALRVTEAVLDNAPHLAFIQQPSAGVETIDLQATAARGIPVANSGAANSVAVAEWCVMVSMALLRDLIPGHTGVLEGGWPQLELAAREIGGARIGILGMGRIGAETASRLTALGAQVSYWSRTRKPDAPWDYQSLDALLAGSDVVISLLPSTPDTRRLIDADLLAKLPPGALLVSAGRGDVIDEPALLAALQSGQLGGAALDVYTVEPLPADSPLRTVPHVLLSPHRAGATNQARLAIVGAAQYNLRAATSGEPLRDVVNGVTAQVTRRRPD